MTGDVMKEEVRKHSNKSSQPRRIWSGSGVRIRTPDPNSGSGLLSTFNGDLLGYIYGKIFMKIRSPRRYKPNCGKNAVSRSVEESFKKFLYPDPEADDCLD